MHVQYGMCQTGKMKKWMIDQWLGQRCICDRYIHCANYESIHIVEFFRRKWFKSQYYGGGSMISRVRRPVIFYSFSKIKTQMSM